MSRKLIFKIILLGFMSWLIPFAASFLFYKPGGELMVPYATFKSAILIIGTMSGCYLLFRYFKHVDHDFIMNGIVVGLSWFAINILFDVIILIPMMKTSFTSYFMSIGLGYLAIPVISIAMGSLLNRNLKKKAWADDSALG